MSYPESPWSSEAERLVREYLAALAGAAAIEQDVLDNLLAQDESKVVQDVPPKVVQHPRPDLVTVAVLTARAVAAESGLSEVLGHTDGRVVVLDTRTAGVVDLASWVVRKCMAAKTEKRLIVIARDGSEKSHIPARGNGMVIDALNEGQAIIVGISPSPRDHLPSALLRTATHRISLPKVDTRTIRTVLEAVTGTRFTGEIDDDLAAMVDSEDLALSFHHTRSPEQCLSRLALLVRAKSDPVEPGPTLEELEFDAAAKNWGMDLVSDLKEYRAGHLQWAGIANRALLLSGPPGVGKSIFPRALARSAGIRLIATSVAEWNASSHLSGTLVAIKKAFDTAISQSPSILWIDEIDGISSRSNLSGEYVEYWLQIVNCLLERLSDLASKEGIVVIATTNAPERIDPALLRAGRIDGHIAIARPDIDNLAKIFRFYLGADLDGGDLKVVAMAARGGTGADVETWVRRARAVARRQRRALTAGDLLAEIRGNMGQISPALRRRISVHEAGHALAAKYLGIGSLVGVSILGTGGATQLAEREGDDMDEVRLDATLAFFLAGRAAEALVLGNVGLGSGGTADHNDLVRATALARMAETVYGFGVAAGLVHIPVDAASLARFPGIVGAVRSRLDRAFEVAKTLVSTNRAELDTIANALATHDYLSSSDIDALTLGPARKQRLSSTPTKAKYSQ